jgi:hypothetical protein
LQREVLWQANARREFEPHGKPRLSSWALFVVAVQAVFAKFKVVSSVDKAIVSAGVGTAAASAGFAVFMLSTDHSHPSFNGIEHLMLFAQPLHGRPSPLVAKDQTTGPAPGVDYSATGVIPRRGQAASDPRDTARPAMPETEPVIKTYVLEQADFGVAVVQGRGSAYRIRPGAYLPGAGRIISIEQRGDKWVVVTTQGVIESRAP